MFLCCAREFYGLFKFDRILQDFNIPGVTIRLDDYIRCVFLFFVGLLGYYGAYKRNPKHLYWVSGYLRLNRNDPRSKII